MRRDHVAREPGYGCPGVRRRARELAALDAVLGRIRDGRPSAVLIGGEAGVGNSRLGLLLHVGTTRGAASRTEAAAIAHRAGIDSEGT